MDWKEIDNRLYKKYTFNSFSDAILFMQNSVEGIDKMNHHPEWKNTYNRVEVWLCTHDAGNVITEKDRELARYLDDVYIKF